MSEITLGNLTISRDRYEVWVNGRPVTLTFVEFELLWELVRHASSVIPRSHLMRTVWHESATAPSTKINAQVCRLRQKMTGADWVIETHAKRGYSLVHVASPAGERRPNWSSAPNGGLVFLANRLPIAHGPVVGLLVAVILCAVLLVAVDDSPWHLDRVAIAAQGTLMVALLALRRSRERVLRVLPTRTTA